MTDLPEAMVLQCDRDAAADFYGPHLSRSGEVLVTAHMRAGKIDESPLIQAFAAHRRAALTAAGVAEMREALERIAEYAEEQLPLDQCRERIAWIESELEDEPFRSMYGDDDNEPCRNGHEVTELVRELFGLIAQAALQGSSHE